MRQLKNKSIVLFLVVSTFALHGMEKQRVEAKELKVEESHKSNESANIRSGVLSEKIVAAISHKQKSSPVTSATLENFTRPPRSDSSTSPLTSLDLSNLKEQHQNLAALQGVYVDQNHSPVAYHPEIMDAPIHKYVEKLKTDLGNQYTNIPDAILTPILETYAVDFLDAKSKGVAGSWGGTVGNIALGFNKVSVADIMLDTSWEKAKPSRCQAIAAGIDALQTLFHVNSLFNQKYKANYQNEFMSATANDYFVTLHTQFPHVPDEILIMYVTKFLDDHNDKYNTKFSFALPFWTQDRNNPIKTQPADIIKNPGWDSHEETEVSGGDRQTNTVYTPTPLQKLYVAIQAIEEIHASYEKNDGAILTPSLFAGVETFRKVAANPIEFAQNYLNSQPGKHVLNNALNQAAQTGIDLVSTAINSALKENPEHTPSAWFYPDQTTLNAAQELRQQSLIAAGQVTAKVLQVASDSLGTPADSVAYSEQAKNKTILRNTVDRTDGQERADRFEQEKKENPQDAQDVSIENFKKNKDVIVASGITNFITRTFKAAVRSIKTREQLKNVIRGIVGTLYRLAGYPEVAVVEMDNFVEQQIHEAQHPETGFFGQNDLTESQFDSRYNSWITKLTARFYTLIGVNNPADIQIIQINKNNSNQLTPKITLNYNTHTKQVRSATIEYNGYTRAVDSEHIKSEDGVYTITGDLFKKPKKITTNQGIYNRLVGNIVLDPFLQETPAGQAGGPSAAETIKSSLLVNSEASDGKITITFNTNSKEISTLVEKQMPNTAKFIRKKVYNPKSITQNTETVTAIPPQGGGTVLKEIFTPTVTITYLPNATTKGVDQIQSANIEYIDPYTKQIFSGPIDRSKINYDSKGNYTIETAFQFKEDIQQQPQTISSEILSQIPNDIKSQLVGQAFEGWIKSLSGFFTMQQLKKTFPKEYEAIERWLVSSAPKRTEHMTIVYNPKESITTTVRLRMTDNTLKDETLTYQID
jgi:hypothetical protein